MPSFITMSTGSRTRILALRPGQDATAVTSLADPALAGQVAQALTLLGADVPGLVLDLLTAAHVLLPDPTDWEYTNDLGRDRSSWMTDPAHTAPVDVTRRLLATYDATGPVAPPLQGVTAVRDLVAGESDSVRRAVRECVAGLTPDYDGVPVLGYAYDYKYGECSWLVLLTGALNVMDNVALTRLVASGDAGEALGVLEARGDVEVPSQVGQVADQGYLRVEAHPAQMRSWLALNHPDLLAAYDPSTAG